MPSLREHALVGLAAGVGLYALCRWKRGEPWRWPSAAACAGGGMLAACLPDVLEPAVHPNHRSHLHSIASVAVAAYAVKALLASSKADGDTKLVLTATATGFATHHLLDSGTPRGLPLL